jgi:NADPH2:quinone reductase
MTQARRWLARDFGGPDVLEEVVVDLPDAGAGEVTVEVRACGMNPADYKHFRPGQDPSEAPAAVLALQGAHPYGKLALVA